MNPKTFEIKYCNVVYIDEKLIKQQIGESTVVTDLQNIETVWQEFINWLPAETTSQPIGPSSEVVIRTEGEAETGPRETETTTSVRRSDRINKSKPPERYGFCENLI